MKLAVLFTGIGYTCDKPLLYYASKLAKNYGYEVWGQTLYLTEDADHSLETGDMETDLENMKLIMNQVEMYMK